MLCNNVGNEFISRKFRRIFDGCISVLKIRRELLHDFLRSDPLACAGFTQSETSPAAEIYEVRLKDSGSARALGDKFADTTIENGCSSGRCDG